MSTHAGPQEIAFQHFFHLLARYNGNDWQEVKLNKEESAKLSDFFSNKTFVEKGYQHFQQQFLETTVKLALGGDIFPLQALLSHIPLREKVDLYEKTIVARNGAGELIKTSLMELAIAAIKLEDIFLSKERGMNLYESFDNLKRVTTILELFLQHKLFSMAKLIDLSPQEQDKFVLWAITRATYTSDNLLKVLLQTPEVEDMVSRLSEGQLADDFGPIAAMARFYFLLKTCQIAVLHGQPELFKKLTANDKFIAQIISDSADNLSIQEVVLCCACYGALMGAPQLLLKLLETKSAVVQAHLVEEGKSLFPHFPRYTFASSLSLYLQLYACYPDKQETIAEKLRSYLPPAPTEVEEKGLAASALHWAIITGNEEVFAKELKKSSPEILNADNAFNPLQLALMCAQPKMALAIAKNSKVLVMDFPPSTGRMFSIFELAAILEEPALVAELLSKKTEVEGRKLFSRARHRIKPTALLPFLKHKVSVDTKESDNPFYIDEAVKCLLSNQPYQLEKNYSPAKELTQALRVDYTRFRLSLAAFPQMLTLPTELFAIIYSYIYSYKHEQELVRNRRDYLQKIDYKWKAKEQHPAINFPWLLEKKVEEKKENEEITATRSLLTSLALTGVKEKEESESLEGSASVVTKKMSRKSFSL